jgi:hypothetical protein
MNCLMLEIQANPWRIFAGGRAHWKWPDQPNGGLYYSTTGSPGSWQLVPAAEQLPTNQFSTMAVDPQNPNRILLGTVQNGIWIGEPLAKQSKE